MNARNSPLSERGIHSAFRPHLDKARWLRIEFRAPMSDLASESLS